jgi:DNA-binding winged helix-turn-helix (wHTH) protein/TolB-like protein
MRDQTKLIYEFGPFRLDVTERVLFRDREIVALKPKVFETLLVLVESAGHVIERDELMKTLWPDTVVEENNLNQYISALRRALGDGENAGQYIETVPRRGYRFLAEVRESGDAPVDFVFEKHTLSNIVIEQEERHNNSVLNPLVRSRLAKVNLRVIATLTVLGVLVVAGYFLISARSNQPEAVSAVKSMAVLPFKALSTDANDEYMGLGMTDALITRLGGVNEIVVRSTSAVRKYTAEEKDPVAIGRELKVEAVLDGSIQKVGDRVRLTLQLVRVGDGRQLWTDKFDAKFTDLLTLEDSISERVAGALALKLSGEERKELAKRYTENGEAYILYLRGEQSSRVFSTSNR